MLKKELRLDRSFFKALTRPLKTTSGKVFSLRVFDIGSSKPSKFAVSVSKKQEKRAVARNRIRRVAYRTIKEHLNEVNSGLVYHFIFNKKPKDFKNDITSDIANLMQNK